MAIVVDTITQSMDSLEYALFYSIFISVGLVYLIAWIRTFISVLDLFNPVYASNMTSVQLYFNDREFVRAHFL